MHNVDNLFENSEGEKQFEFFSKVKDLCLFFENKSVVNKNSLRDYWEVEEFSNIEMNFKYNSKDNLVNLENKNNQIIAQYDLNERKLYSILDFYVPSFWKEIVDFHYSNFITN